MGRPVTANGRLAAAGIALAIAALAGMEAAAASPSTFVVNSTGDALDANLGDGTCATGAGVCTLRAAIQQANALPGADVVEVPSGTYEIAIPPLNQNDITTGDLDITDSVAITGAGAGATIIDAGVPRRARRPTCTASTASSRWPSTAGEVSFSGLTLQDGYADEYGGAIANNGSARVTVTASVLTRNVAEKAGGAIDNHFGGTVEVRDSTDLGQLRVRERQRSQQQPRRHADGRGHHGVGQLGHGGRARRGAGRRGRHLQQRRARHDREHHRQRVDDVRQRCRRRPAGRGDLERRRRHGDGHGDDLLEERRGGRWRCALQQVGRPDGHREHVHRERRA